MEYTQNDKTQALAGIYQAAQMVYELATTGKTDEHAFEVMVNTLFIENPRNTMDVYGASIDNLQLGIHTLLAQMQSEQVKQTRNIEITRYVLSLMVLQKKIKQTDGLQKISNVLETASAQREHFGPLHENVIATIARAYSENVSTLHPRIMVNGQHTHLNNQRIANKIRALLLAGLRSAVLWYQVGGSRWGLIWSRKKYLQSAQTFYRANYTHLQRNMEQDQKALEEQQNAGGWYQGKPDETPNADSRQPVDELAQRREQKHTAQKSDKPEEYKSMFLQDDEEKTPSSDTKKHDDKPENK